MQLSKCNGAARVPPLQLSPTRPGAHLDGGATSIGIASCGSNPSNPSSPGEALFEARLTQVQDAFDDGDARLDDLGLATQQAAL